MGPCVNIMPEKDSGAEIIEFKGESTSTKESVLVSSTEEVGEAPNAPEEKDRTVKPKPGESLTPDAPVPEPKPFTWMDVKFPAYFKGPHFVQVKGSIVLAIDPDCVSMEMRTNWQNIYVPELAALGKKIIEKHLKIKIEKLD